MNTLLIVTMLLAVEPDLATYRKECQAKAQAKITGLTAKLNSAKGADRQKIRDEISALKKSPPLIELPTFQKAGEIGTIPNKLRVKDTAGPSVRVAVFVTVYRYNFEGTARTPIGEKEGGELIVDDVDSTQWKVGDTITLPPDLIFVVERPGELVRCVNPTPQAKALREKIKQNQTK